MEVVRLHMRDTYDVAPWEWDSGELELAIYELITKNQAKNNEVLDLVSKCDCSLLVACEICGDEKRLDGDFWKNKDVC